MILSGHQPSYIPWLGLFHKIAISDIFCFMDSVQYEKNSFINRNKIKVQGKSQWLTIPVETKDYKSKFISDIYIDNKSIDLTKICPFDINEEFIKPLKDDSKEINSIIMGFRNTGLFGWRRKHWKNIEFAYKKTPYFDEYSDLFLKIYQSPFVKLSDINYVILVLLLNILEIKTPVIRMSDYIFSSKKTNLICDMCKTFNCDSFIFGKNGIDYVNNQTLAENNINCFFQDYFHPNYQQNNGEFIPYLSIIDLLFNNGPSSVFLIMKDNISRNEIKNKLSR